MTDIHAIYNVTDVYSDKVTVELHEQSENNFLNGNILSKDLFLKRYAYLVGDSVIVKTRAFQNSPVNSAVYMADKSSEDSRNILLIFTVEQWAKCGFHFSKNTDPYEADPTVIGLINKIRHDFWVHSADFDGIPEEFPLQYGLTPDELLLVFKGYNWRHAGLADINHLIYEDLCDSYISTWNNLEEPINHDPTIVEMRRKVNELYGTTIPVVIEAFEPDDEDEVVRLVRRGDGKGISFMTISLESFRNILIPYYLRIWRPDPETKTFLDGLVSNEDETIF
jgi:hypothetical protein